MLDLWKSDESFGTKDVVQKLNEKLLEMSLEKSQKVIQNFLVLFDKHFQKK